jgi:hypothetical protein
MPSPYISKPVAKPKLPAPSFRYASNTYVLLAYAKMKNKPFTVEAVRNFNLKYSENSQVTRAIKVLLNNGSISKVTEDSWIITPTGIQQIIDFAARRSIVATWDREK